MGEVFALACALVWASAVMFFRRSGETVPALALNLFRVVASSVLFLLTLAVMGRNPLAGAAPADVGILVLSGVIAIAISDTLFHLCLNRVGAGLNAIVTTLYAPFTAMSAFLLLGERLGLRELGGMILIIGGVVVASRVAPPPGTSRRTLVTGILYGVGSMVALAVGIVIAKPVLQRMDVVGATAVRQIGSMLVLLPIAALLPGRAKYFAVFRPSRTWRFTVPGMVLGSYLALILWIAGMKYTETGTAAALNQTSTVFTLVFASLLLKEAFGRRKATASVLALVGIALVVLPL
ncbi:MAG: DMT family transporter [bacterium]|nr:DMT family transporter [bacterium]